MLSTTLAVLLFALPEIPSYARPAYQLAPADVREAIDEAYAAADPDGSHPWWHTELYLICARESRCGREGLVGVHVGDSWASDLAWSKAVDAGQLDPIDCDAHAWAEGEWSTRGLFGMNAARSIGSLGCKGPDAMDDPATAASLALDTFASCSRWSGVPGQRRRLPCTCIDHTRLWVGAGVWARRPLFGKRSRLTSVARQCGPGAAAWLFVVESGWLIV